MQPTFTFFQLIFLLSAVQGFILSGLILRKKSGKASTWFLGSFILAFALASLKIVLQETIPDFRYKFPVPLLYQFAFGPLFYLYVKSSLHTGFRFTAKVGWHFLPVLLFDVLLFAVISFLGQGANPKQVYGAMFFTDCLAFISFAAYCGYAWRLIVHYKKQLSKSEISSRTAVFQWLNQLTIAAGLIGFAWLSYLLLVLTGSYKYLMGNMLPYYPAYVVVGAGIYWIGIKGYFQPHIDLISLPVPEKKILFAPDVLEEKKAGLLAAMRQHRYYCDEKITVQSLARQLDLPLKDLSHLINTGFGQNFNDFINQLRVEELKERLPDPKQRKYSVMGLATEVGFNSKPSFYRAFKKFTGQTPTEYLKKHLQTTDPEE